MRKNLPRFWGLTTTKLLSKGVARMSRFGAIGTPITTGLWAWRERSSQRPLPQTDARLGSCVDRPARCLTRVVHYMLRS
eukprot:1945467-Heterocapsa_arctica.AAC.1